MSKESLNFAVDARLVAQLGEQLVPSDVTALAELVKNAYDADATTVLIDYRPDATPPCLIIEDDGHGMTIEDVRRGWMIIGTTMKESARVSPRYKRGRTGQKGIGRFAAQRLGKRLTLWSTAEGSDKAVEIDFDWNAFKSGLALEDIGYRPRLAPVAKKEHGTRLTIRELKREWSEADLKEVLEELIRIQAPRYTRPARGRKAPADPGFSVLVSISGLRLQQDIDELDLLRDERSWTLTGKVDESGRATHEFKFHRPKGKTIRESFPRPLKTGPLGFSLDVFVYKRETLERLTIRQASDLGKRYGGCQIWRDGFRVFPYGAPDDDWLGLDAHVSARRPPLTMPRNQQILGGVQITRVNNRGLIDLLTRRGLVDNLAFRDLKTFVFEGLKIGANEHAALAAKQSRGGPARSKPSEATLREVERARAGREARRQARLSSFERAAAKGGISEQALKDLEEAAEVEERAQRQDEEKLIQTVEDIERELLDENSMLRVLASLGTGLAAFSHELRMVGSAIGLATQEIEALVRKCPQALAQRMRGQVNILRNGIEDLAAYRKYIDDFIQAGSRRKRQPVELGPYIRELLKTFQNFLDARSVAPSCEIPRGLFTVPIHRAELNSIVFNLLTNAVKAVLLPGVAERKILFKGYQDNQQVCLLVADTGCGIAESIAHRMFEPFVTRAHVQDDEALGMGTGLGLSIVKDILEAYGGTIGVVAAPTGYRTAFEVRVPPKE